MTVTDLLANFAKPEVMQSLSFSDKLFAGAITTVLGMGITFAALIILQFIISWMEKILNNSSKKIVEDKPAVTTGGGVVQSPPSPHEDDKELIAVIATTIAMHMKTSVDNIVIRNITRLDDRSPAWNRAGIVEQMNSRF